MGQISIVNPPRADETGTLSIILLSASMLSLVITFMGIKLKWFRHRLTLEQPEIATDTPAVLMRTTSATEFRENCARGVYRQSVDSESLILSERPPNPATNGKAKSKTSYRQSIFHFPVFRSKLSLSRGTSHEERSISTIQQAASSAQQASREQDVATHEKNEHLKRMIHEKLHGTSSGSLPELQAKKIKSPRRHRERSVDEAPRPSPRVQVQSNIQPPVLSAQSNAPPTAQRSLPPPQNVDEDPSEELTIFEFVRGFSVVEANGKASSELSTDIPDVPAEIEKNSSKSVHETPMPDKDLQKRVKFEEVNEIKETFYEVHVDEAFGESSTDEPFGYQKAPSPFTVEEVELPPPKPMKRKSRENISQQVSEELIERSDPPVFERVSSEYKFEKVDSGDEFENDPIVVEIPDEKSQTNEVHKTETDGLYAGTSLSAVELPIAAELNAVLEAMPPHVKPRTKRAVERTSDVGKSEEIPHVPEPPVRVAPEKPERASAVTFVQEESQFAQKLPAEVETTKASPNNEELSEPIESFYISNKFSENYENFSHQDFRSDSDTDSSSEARVTPPIENSQVVPKSILKTSENSGVQKTITFHNVPDSVSSSSESFFSDEEQDVWSQVDQQRFHLSRNRMPDTPPPLPKTPPPTAEEESRFSYA